MRADTVVLPDGPAMFCAHHPQERQHQQVRMFGVAMVLLTISDSVATGIWLKVGTAIEGNPLVDWLIHEYGLTAGLGLRTLWSVGLIVALLKVYRHARFGEAAVRTVTVVLAAIGVLHLYGAVLTVQHVVL